VREDWLKRFAESPDCLKSARRQQTVVPVLDLEIGGGEFITMAGPCSVETEFQLMATAIMCAAPERAFFAAAHSSRAVLLMHFKGLAWKG
jgi:3-deoxy-D-arabino-heptulosonate 7-phosphate (DAHP) synthase